uniref:Uncharacterized protein n=1 Tax=Anguilla anguilla TaxID=7936 RepID=A0A0E9QRH6_ANGAN
MRIKLPIPLCLSFCHFLVISRLILTLGKTKPQEFHQD